MQDQASSGLGPTAHTGTLLTDRWLGTNRGNRRMRQVKHGRHERSECRHRKKKIHETAGLRRTVCPKCRSVTVDFIHDVFAEAQEQLRRLTD